MLLTLAKLLVMLVSFNIIEWQTLLYSEVLQRVNSPLYPQTIVTKADDRAVRFFSYSAFYDNKGKYDYVLRDVMSLPTWFFLMRYKGEIKDELWHRGMHDGVACNVFDNDGYLFHIKTIGFFNIDIIFRILYKIKDSSYGTVVQVDMDKSYKSLKVNEFNMLIWTFPHPIIKNLAVIVISGYIATPFSIDPLYNHIKWHIDSFLQNFGERVNKLQ